MYKFCITEEGKAESIEIGKEEGIVIGEARGEEKGIIIGEEKQNKKTIIKLFLKGKTANEISELLDIPVAEGKQSLKNF